MYNKQNKGAFRSFINGISRKTVAIMNVLLLPLTAAFVYIGINFYYAARVDIVTAKDDFFSSFEHLMLSLVIVICGSALLDLSLKELGDDR